VVHAKSQWVANIIIGFFFGEELGDNLKVTAIATGFGDRFDVEQAKTQNIRSIQDVRVDFDKPTFVRKTEPDHRRSPVNRQPSFVMDEDDQFDIPTFLRKSVD